MIIIVVLFVLAAIIIYAIIIGAKAREQAENQIFDANQITDIFSLCEKVSQEINSILSKDLSVLNLSREETLKRERQIETLRTATANACLGNRGDREYLKDYIKELLVSYFKVDRLFLERLLPYREGEFLSSQDKFELMYALYYKNHGSMTISYMIEAFSWQDKLISKTDIDTAYRSSVSKIDYQTGLDMLTQRLYQELYGQDCVDILLADDSLDGISAGIGGKTRVDYNYLDELISENANRIIEPNNYDKIYVVYKGRLVWLQFLSLGNSRRLERIVRNIYRYNSRTALSIKDPVINGNMSDNSRVVVARPPVSNGWAFYVRRFASAKPKSIESLLPQANANKVIALIKGIIEGEFNFVISGNTGGGKTTLLKALVGLIDERYALRVVETNFETDLNNLYPERNIHVMQERGGFTIYDAITATRKMDTDVIIIGEVNEPKLAGAYVQVAQSGSKMAITTLHHENTLALIHYLRNALVTEFGIADVNIAEQQVVNVVDFDIHMVRDVEGNHYIERITEIIPYEYKEFPEDVEAATVEFYKRMTNRINFECHNIVEYDKKLKAYKLCGGYSNTRGCIWKYV